MVIILQKISINRDRFKRISIEGGWIVIGKLASVLGVLFLVRVLTEYLEPAEYGHLALGLTIAGLVNQVVMGGISAGIGRYYSIAVEKVDLLGYLRAVRYFMIISTIVVIAIAIILMGGLTIFGFYQWLWLVLAVLVFSILSGYNGVLNGIQNAARQRLVVALHGGMDAWLKIGLAVGVMLWLGSNSVAVVLGYALSALFVTLSQLFFLRRLIVRQVSNNNHESNENWIRQIWHFSWPFSAWGIFTWVQQASDRWALEGFATTFEVGQYAVVYQLGYVPIGILTGLMMTLIGPILYQYSGTAHDKSRNKYVHRVAWRITYACLALTTLAVIVTWLFHDWFFSFLVAAAFREVSFLLPWIVLAGGLFASGQMLSLKLMSELRSRSLLIVKITTALIGISLNVLFAWLFGMKGVVGALILFSALYLIWMVKLSVYLPVVDTQARIQ